MKPNAPFMLTEELQTYLENTFCPLDEDLKALKTQTDKMPEHKMQITPEQGRFLQFLIQSHGFKDVLEIGVYTGTSTLYMAKALPESGTIIALDRNKEWTKIAQKYWKFAGVDHKINLIIGDACLTLNECPSESIDLIFIDADKKNYPQYVKQSLRLIRPTGMIIIDNLFMNGKVLSHPDDETVQIMTKLHADLSKDQRIIITFLPFYDGMLLMMKR